ncbi:MAG: T9SS type A sorting domain-containing protein [Bacteroidales bacterium]|nr:T9SS type A sorting domain-containing protein [Bacteroidales bacterium]
MASIRNEDQEDEKMGVPKRVGVAVKAGIDIMREGKQDILPDGTKIWRIIIACKDAQAIGLSFDDFHLEAGYRMFIYDKSYRYLLGAYTLSNNKQHRLFSTELIPADKLVIEINASPGITATASCHLSGISYVYDDFPDFLRNRGISDDCEVNINCPEGANWQFQKHGVTRIYVKQGGGYFWCTGALLNNTLQNNEPYLLTADHCGPTASADDLAQWIFYFNYEAPECENPTVNPVPNSMTGAEKLANANTSGSDFLLLRLDEDIPDNYEPYYNGWSIENIASPSGVTIHHPAGDIRKISTYTQQIQSSAWYSTPGTHWQVFWSETETNWGVTEGGSSGAPLYDNFGRIIGALTGGQAACEPDGSGTGPDQPDYYGKFSYSWDQNGNDPSQQLKYWLDPINAGVTSLPGKNAKLTAAFQASQTLILTGSMVTFTNYSSGIPNFYEWTFEGGNPSSYSGSDSIEIKYAEAGQYDVRLVVSDGFDFDTLLLTDYIHVVGKVYPNPTQGTVNIFLEEELPADVHAEVFNIMGQKIYEKQIPEQSYPLISLDLSLLGAGTYTIRLEIKQRFVFARVIVLEP